MALRIIIVLISMCCFAPASYAKSFSCKITGHSQSSFKISKGKVGNYRAKVVGNNVVVNVPGAKMIVKPNGKATINGGARGKMKCDMAKVRRVVTNG